MHLIQSFGLYFNPLIYSFWRERNVSLMTGATQNYAVWLHQNSFCILDFTGYLLIREMRSSHIFALTVLKEYVIKHVPQPLISNVNQYTIFRTPLITIIKLSLVKTLSAQQQTCVIYQKECYIFIKSD